MVRYATALLVVLLSGCSAITAPQYVVDPELDARLKELPLKAGIALGAITGPAELDNNCRAVGAIAPPNGLSFAAYVQQALREQLRASGLEATSAPRVALTGTLEKIVVESRRGPYDYRGRWQFTLSLRSSTGKSMRVEETYEFPTAFLGDVACQRTAEALLPAVRKLVTRTLVIPEFRALTE